MPETQNGMADSGYNACIVALAAQSDPYSMSRALARSPKRHPGWSISNVPTAISRLQNALAREPEQLQQVDIHQKKAYLLANFVNNLFTS